MNGRVLQEPKMRKGRSGRQKMAGRASRRYNGIESAAVLVVKEFERCA